MGRQIQITYKKTPMYTLPDYTGKGVVAVGNIDLANRPTVHLADGSIATVRSMGVNIGGKEYLIPTISQDGRELDNQQAIDEFRKTGQHLGAFDNPDDSTAYAIALHNQQDKMYS